MVKPNSVNSVEALAKLWIHESSRVFADRFVNQDDRNWFNNQIVELVVRWMKLTWNHEDLFKNSICFSDVLKLEATTILYEEVTEKKKLVVKQLEDKQEDYNSSQNDRLELVYFDDAVEHILKIARMLRQPRGNGMLIGLGGSGKQSLAKLSSFLMKC